MTAALYDLYEIAKYYEDLTELDFLYKLENGYQFKLVFKKADFHNLIGFEKLIDLPQISKANYNVRNIFKDVLEKKIKFEDINKSKYIEVIMKRIKYFHEIKDMVSCGKIRYYKQNKQWSSVPGCFVFDQKKQILLSKPEYEYINLIIDIGNTKKNEMFPRTFFVHQNNFYCADRMIDAKIEIKAKNEKKKK